MMSLAGQQNSIQPVKMFNHINRNGDELCTYIRWDAELGSLNTSLTYLDYCNAIHRVTILQTL